jgi:hypothetical protein
MFNSLKRAANVVVFCNKCGMIFGDIIHFPPKLWKILRIDVAAQ